MMDDTLGIFLLCHQCMRIHNNKNLHMKKNKFAITCLQDKQVLLFEKCWWLKVKQFNPSGNETAILRTNQVNTMAGYHSYLRCQVNKNHGIDRVFVFHVELSKLPVPSQCWDIIENANTCSVIFADFSPTKG